MRLLIPVLLGTSGCNWVFGNDRTDLRPGLDAGVLPDADPRIDLDRDGIKDVEDPCIAPDTDLLIDSDSDGHPNGMDLCPFIYDSQSDSDKDGIGDGCDPFPLSAGDRVRCLMALSDPDMNVQMWKPRDQPTTWELFNPRTLVGRTGSVIADWPFEGPAITTYVVTGQMFSPFAPIHVHVRAATDAPARTDSGCKLSPGPSWLISTEPSGQIGTVGSPSSTVVAAFKIEASFWPGAPIGMPNIRCAASVTKDARVEVGHTVPLLAGRFAIGIDGAPLYITSITVYERDDVPK